MNEESPTPSRDDLSTGGADATGDRKWWQRLRWPFGRGTWFGRYLAAPTLLGVALLAYIAFFGDRSVTQRIAYQHIIDSLQVCLAQQQDSLEFYRDLNRRLNTDPQLMEQVVRERYNMKRPNEDIYVVEKSTEDR